MSDALRVPPVEVRVLPIAQLLPDQKNPRKINSGAMARLHGSLSKFGLLDLPVWNEPTGELVAGHQRVERLAAQGYTGVACLVTQFDPHTQTLANIALNAPYGEFDAQKMKERLEEIQAAHLDIDDTMLPPYILAPLLQGQDFGVGESVIAQLMQQVRAGAQEADPVASAPTGKPAIPASVTCPHCGGTFSP